MKTLFLAIQQKLATTLDIKDLQFIQMWNNQLENINDGGNYSFLLPAIFIEFVNNQNVDSVGGGVQVFDPLDINVHIIHDQYDSTDGTMDQNLEVLDLKQKVYKALQLFKTNGSGYFNRVSEDQDYNHSNIYHFIQTYRTTWTDCDRELPYLGIDKNAPFTTNINTVIDN
jgi:hypothetical protein